MKLNREQITELFGSAPEDQDGKKLVGIEGKTPKDGDLYFKNETWYKSGVNKSMKYPVAIFKATRCGTGKKLCTKWQA